MVWSSVRGSQTRHSRIPRTRSMIMNQNRPAWLALRRDHRPIYRRRSRVFCSDMGDQSKAFIRKLLIWYKKAARDLPWRETRNPYAILVSEIMLQQTQVSRVLEYFPRFMSRFPTIDTLARARPKAVMEQWDGLGYYARARNLHKL